ncbi:Insulin receptor [Armadillidium nasatum]|uniref:Insulin receptor n=1 Tax=Armadillidium nasatum TaxID=96803 RepID=A0A5N5T6U5_9CRUS|nr:Insulin receptor [Armadillidium nasatum]
MVEILCQVSLAMSYLHDNRFIHRDLAARNILVRHTGTRECPPVPCPPITVKVADFGRARDLNEDDIYVQATDRPIPVRWTSPEALMNAKFWDKKCDVWSFGVLIYEIVTKSINNPYDCGSKKYTDKQVKEMVPVRGIKIRPPPNCSKFLGSLMEDCLQFDPQPRPTFTEILHKLLSSEFVTDDFLVGRFFINKTVSLKVYYLLIRGVKD